MDIASYLIGSKLGGGGGGGGGASVESKDVDFIDYDGTIVYSYSKADFLALSAMPDNPSHDGLTAQGWNWTLADAQAYVSANGGYLCIGQNYDTVSGKTEIDILVPAGKNSMYLGFAVNGTAKIDWGDGSAEETVTGTSVSTNIYTPHTFPADGGLFTISIDGAIAFIGTTSYSYVLNANGTNSSQNLAFGNMVQAVRLSSNAYARALGTYAFIYCYSLKSISIPRDMTHMENFALANCPSLKGVVLPPSVTTIYGTVMAGCSGLEHVAYAKTSPIAQGGNNNDSLLRKISFPVAAALTQQAVYNCYGLNEATIPSGVTSIGTQAFSGCYSLVKVTIPDTVTSIAANAFQNCYGLTKIRFGGSTPPTVANSNAFSNVPTSCIIEVPSGSKATYTSATNYPSSATYTYVEY